MIIIDTQAIIWSDDGKIGVTQPHWVNAAWGLLHAAKRAYHPEQFRISIQTSCTHKWGQYTPALITTHLIQKYPIKISILIIFSESFRNPIFGQIFGHQRAENGARNTKIYRSQETHAIRVNASIKWNEPIVFFKKFQKHHFRPNIWSPEDRKWG